MLTSQISKRWKWKKWFGMPSHSFIFFFQAKGANESTSTGMKLVSNWGCLCLCLCLLFVVCVCCLLFVVVDVVDDDDDDVVVVVVVFLQT